MTISSISIYLIMNDENILFIYVCSYLSIGEPSSDTVKELYPMMDMLQMACNKGIVKSVESFNRFLNSGIKAFNGLKNNENYLWLNDTTDIPFRDGFLEIPDNMSKICKHSIESNSLQEKIRECKNGSLIVVDLCIIDKTRPNLVVNL